MTSGVYEIVNTVNGKRYVGSSIDVERRWKEHLRMLNRGAHVNAHLQNSWNKHGEEAFTFSILSTCGPEKILQLEQDEIDIKSEFNMTPVAGSTLGMKMSDEFKAGAAERMRTRWKDEEYRELQSERMRTISNANWSNEDTRKSMIESIRADKIEGHASGRLKSPLKDLWKIEEYRNARTGEKNHNFNPELYNFHHRDHGSISCTKLHLSKTYGVDRSDINKLVSGKIKSILGWRIEKAPFGA